MEKRVCVICNNKYTPRIGKQETCGDKSCCDKNNYRKNKDRYIENARRWDKLNPEKSKESHKKSLEKFRKNKPERFNELMRNGYHRNKDKWNSRTHTNAILNSVGYKEINPLKKQCACGSIENLEVHHEIYPTKADDIRKAITDGKIYYKCRKCHGRRNGHVVTKQ